MNFKMLLPQVSLSFCVINIFLLLVLPTISLTDKPSINMDNFMNNLTFMMVLYKVVNKLLLNSYSVNTEMNQVVQCRAHVLTQI